MPTKIKILIAEHDKHDLEMIDSELKRGGINFVSEIVQSESNYRKALENFIPDVILCDYTFPSFDGPVAFKIREAVAPETPFILVSGTIGEENSIELIKNGVTDFVLKDKIFTLNTKLLRALKDVSKQKEKDRTKKELALSESKLARAQQLAKLGSWELNFDDNELRLSVEGARIFGFPIEQNRLSFETWSSLVHPDDIDEVLQTIQQSRNSLQDTAYHHRIVLKDGTVKHIYSESKFEFDEPGKAVGLYGTMQDITERKKAELEIIKFNRLYAFISAINQSIVYTNTADELIKKACSIAIEIGNFKLAWIGLLNESGKLEVMNVAGEGDVIQVAKKPSGIDVQDSIYRNTPVGKVLQTGVYAASNDVLVDPDMQFLTGVLLSSGIRSNIVFPIKKAGKVAGVFSFNSDTPHFFDVSEIALLQEATNDISFALQNFERAEKHKKAEEKIKVNQQELKLIYNSTNDVLFLIGVQDEKEFSFISMNETGLQAMGITLKQLQNKHVKDIIPRSSLHLVLGKYKEAIDTKKTVHWEETSEYATGIKTGIVSISPIYNEAGKCIQLVGTVYDITERKKAEQLISQSEAKFRSFFESSMDGILLTVTDGDILAANPAACEIFKMTEEEICTAGRFGIVDISDRRVYKLVEERQRTGRVKGELRLVRKDGSKFEAELTSAVFTDSFGNERTSMIVRDISDRKKLENTLKAEQQRFAGLYAQSPTIMGILKGPNHIFETANPPCLQLIGKTDIIGKTVGEALPELEAQGIFEILDDVYKTGKTFSGNEMLFRFDLYGTGILVNTYLNLMYQAHRNNQNQIDGIFFFAIDVSEQVLSRKKIEESEKEIRSMAESMPQIVWVTNAQGENIYFNQQWVDYTGLALEDSYGAGWTNPFHPDDKILARDAWKNAVENLAEYNIECRLKCYDGSYHWWLIRGVPKIDDNGEILKWYGTCTDIEKIKKTEEKLKDQAAQLTLSNLELEQFAYVASHDLQEPLRMVINFLTLLEDKYSCIIDEKGKKFIGFAVDGARRMRTIIQDLLEFSRVGRLNGNIENVDLNALVKVVELMLRKQMDEKNASIRFQNLPLLYTQKSSLLQVFQNLVSNALKYSKENIPVCIDITATESEDHWQFAISDNGIGIHPQFFDKIFIIFQRLHNKDKYSGTGMGLTIVKKIIESRGGEIWVQSEPGIGSTFYFTILKAGRLEKVENLYQKV
ncbi:MAG: domain S-box-containing protein [Ferruginibacter sp.]|uniref:PAS domain S-box protein n=1 Tax=Ferruginibacter sp. TaxID=1940288 RepID=UPI0026596A55|nr:PAS domain S-box protein [Ferruginibacter sp.]MDB5280797.1 domain S-box-containing protein [Ferruginibacter sp.]